MTVAPDLPEHGTYQLNDPAGYSMPLIIAPVKRKPYLRYGRTFSALWQRAESSLQHCERLYVIGYSFPETDEASRAMFERALSSGDQVPDVVIINPDPDRVVSAMCNAGADRRRMHVVRGYFDGGFPE